MRRAAQRIADAARERLGTAGDALSSRGGRFDLTELRALIARAALFIGGDSGPLHIAATTRVPIVELSDRRWPNGRCPWRDPRWFAEIVDAGALPCRPCHQRTCVPGDFRCLTSIGPSVSLPPPSVRCVRQPGPTAATAGSNERRIPVVHG